MSFIIIMLLVYVFIWGISGREFANDALWDPHMSIKANTEATGVRKEMKWKMEKNGIVQTLNWWGANSVCMAARNVLLL